MNIGFLDLVDGFFVLKVSLNCMYFVNIFIVMYYKDKS